MSTLPTNLEETLDPQVALQVVAYELISEAARDRKAAKRKRLLGIRLGHLAKMSRADIARADETVEGTIRGLERRASKNETCEQCAGSVRPEHYCPNCGRQGPESAS